MDKDFTESFKQETRKHATPNSMADATGLPDSIDKKRIEHFLAVYEKHHPGELQAIKKFAQDQHAAQGGRLKDFSEVNKQARGRVLFELPEPVGKWMEQAYPLMFKDKRHTAWFAKNFKWLLIPPKY